MLAASDNLRHRCDHREAEYKDMNVFLDLPDGFYAVKNHEMYMVDLPVAKWKGAKSIKIPEFTFQCLHQTEPISDEIQHVSYDDAQLGREK